MMRAFLLLLISVSPFFSARAQSVIQFSKNEVKAIENGQDVKVDLVRSGSLDEEVSVTFATEDISARAGSDYESVRQVVTFPPGEDHQFVYVRILVDEAVELPERLRLVLSEPSAGAELGDRQRISMRIVMISNDAVVLGILSILLALVFHTSHLDHPGWKKFYKYVPSLLLCYFLPSLFSTAGIISPDHSQLYYISSRFLLPCCLVLLCLSIDIPGILRLGPKALIMFATGTIGIVLGGPLSYWLVGLVSPGTVEGLGADSVWRGMTTVAGSWIGGGANQTAMKEVFQVGDSIFSAMIAVDIIVANIWMAFLLYAAGESDIFDKRLKADNSAIKKLQHKIADYQSSIAKIPTLTDLMKLLGIGFAITAVGHFVADIAGPWIGNHAPDIIIWLGLEAKFFWLIVIATLGGFLLSFTKARLYEGVGASRVGSAFLYVLVASIGMKMDLTAIFHQPGLFVVGMIWIAFHAFLLITVAILIRAPIFFLAVGSQANVGGAASAPIVASAFHPSLAPVGVLLAVFGYFLGTFAAWFCGLILKLLAGA